MAASSSGAIAVFSMVIGTTKTNSSVTAAGKPVCREYSTSSPPLAIRPIQVVRRAPIHCTTRPAASAPAIPPMPSAMPR